MRRSRGDGERSPISGRTSLSPTSSMARQAYTLQTACRGRPLGRSRLPLAISASAYSVRLQLLPSHPLQVPLPRLSSRLSIIRRDRHRFPQPLCPPLRSHSHSRLLLHPSRRHFSLHLLPPRLWPRSLPFPLRSRHHRQLRWPCRHRRFLSPRQRLRCPPRQPRHRRFLWVQPPLPLLPHRRQNHS